MRFFTGFLAYLASTTMIVVSFLPIITFAAEIDKYDSPRDVPRIIYSDGNGNERVLDFSKNRLTALHFWATWCKPCIEELPQVDRIQQIYASRGFKVVPLSMDKNIDVVWKFYQDKNIDNLDMILDSNSMFYWFNRNYKIAGVPTTIFINSEGKATHVSDGALDWEGVEAIS